MWGSEAGGGELRSILKGESLTAERGEGDGEAVIRLEGGDLDLIFSLDFSPLDCCCLACCLHLARRFLNQTFKNRIESLPQARIVNPYIFATQFHSTYIFQTMNSVISNNQKNQRFTPPQPTYRIFIYYLNSGLWQVNLQSYLFSHEYIWISCFLK